jgi:regulatory protein
MPAARPLLSLKARALQWLSQREHSRAELRAKLLAASRRRDAIDTSTSQAAEDPADRGPEVDALLDWLAAHRYLSEARFVESRVHARAQRYGNRRITQELARQGATLDAATAETLKATELERARAVWERKFGAAPATAAADRARQMRFLAGRGFTTEVIRQVMRGSVDD